MPTGHFFYCGNTAQPLCVRYAVRFFVRVHKFDAGGLTPGKENLCAMTGNMQADDVQRRKPWVVRCCLNGDTARPMCVRCAAVPVCPQGAQ